ncbi:SDR family oxidoreductase [Pandoraea anhela]|uniref:Short-chain dehydrogenase n=1 Tax=Pandoraea anhela TaxID=2508295 RepID=A0A5E4WJ33_9BURK|nr:SDR family oxidoreductase [Pandoraea anhela]VVE23076.1 short-chain dehydrogenase [Pandoraea anhela]
MPKRAVITGATRGIGAAIADRLTRGGFEIVGIARETPQHFAGTFFRCDLDDPVETEATFAEVRAMEGISVLVNNAGAVEAQPVGSITVPALDHQWRVNVEASIIGIQALLPGLIANGNGRVINIASGAMLGKPGRTGYAASKAAIVGMTRTLAIELGQHGITVNCVAPGQILTTLWAANNQPDSPKTREMIRSIPMGRLGSVEDVAAAVDFFASEAAAYITGQTLFVCGGLTVGKYSQ